MRVAVLHDWLTGMRGGEKVLEAILELYPSAELFTLFHFPGSVSQVIEKRRIHTSWLQGLASKVSNYRTLLPLFPSAVRGWRFDEFDLVISSSHCVVKGVDAGKARHVSYCHTPMRYIWDRFDDYFPQSRPVLRLAGQGFAPWMRSWDQRTAAGVDLFVANSEFVRGRIRRHYGRDAVVVHPFVDDRFLEAPMPEARSDYHLVVSALVPYKKVDLAIEAARSSGKGLIVVGKGPLEKELAARAGPNVEVRGFVSEGELVDLLGRARSLILPGVEDFGITCLEAMAMGTPVIAYGEGGALDSVVEGETGIFFGREQMESLPEAMERAERMKWDRERIRSRAREFSRARFLTELGRLIQP
ncbi:MAG TPA: glycosyltransferase [Thermoanaerobaculia bacterium]|nr:glycosyltransferase [Thermoanaerobaculia bacterium]